MCDVVGVRPALLVVPNYQGTAPLGADPAFCAWLRALQHKGHEIFLHGLLHVSRSEAATAAEVEAGRPTGLRWRFAQRVASAGAAEFADVSPAEAEARLDEGEATLKAAGLHIDGFVPPAWSMESWLLPILARRGYRFTEDHLRIYDPAAGVTKPSLVLNYASRSTPRMLSTVAYCRAARPLARALPSRFAIHPGDLTRPLLRREVRRMLAWCGPRAVARAGGLFR